MEEEGRSVGRRSIDRSIDENENENASVRDLGLPRADAMVSELEAIARSDVDVPCQARESIVRVRLHRLVPAPLFADSAKRVRAFTRPVANGSLKRARPLSSPPGRGRRGECGVRLRALVRLVHRRILLVPCGFLGGYRARLRHDFGPDLGAAFAFVSPRNAVLPRFYAKQGCRSPDVAEPCSRDATGMCAVVERFTRYTNTRAIASPDGQVRASDCAPSRGATRGHVVGCFPAVFRRGV